MTHDCCDVHRRDVLRSLGLGLLGTSCAGWLPALAAEVAHDPRRRRHCILLWMSGGPSQTDTFDMKPGHANGGEFKEIDTNVPGLRVQRASAEARQARRPARDRPLAEHEGRRPRPRHAPGAHRPPADGRRRVSVDRLLAGQGARGRRDAAAELRERRAAAADQPGRVRARLSGPGVCAGTRRRHAAGRRREQPARSRWPT